jgi:hypothetical protein
MKAIDLFNDKYWKYNNNGFMIYKGRVIWENIRQSKYGDIVISRIDFSGIKRQMVIDSNRELFLIEKK